MAAMLPTGFKVRIFDKAAVAAADDLTVRLLLLERDGI